MGIERILPGTGTFISFHPIIHKSGLFGGFLIPYG
jgi:hypothetical protein